MAAGIHGGRLLYVAQGAVQRHPLLYRPDCSNGGSHRGAVQPDMDSHDAPCVSHDLPCGHSADEPADERGADVAAQEQHMAVGHAVLPVL